MKATIHKVPKVTSSLIAGGRALRSRRPEVVAALGLICYGKKGNFPSEVLGNAELGRRRTLYRPAPLAVLTEST